jgi:hypothetical protein
MQPHGDFEAQITKLELPVLRPKLVNPASPWFWGSTKKPTAGFEVKPGETIATSFEAKLQKTIAADFEAKPLETVTTSFEAKPAKTVQVVLRPNHSQIVTTSFESKPVKTVRVDLRPNHSQTVDLGFEAQPRNTRSSSPRAWCRPHTSPPDLSIARPPSTRPVRPSLVLCTRSPTPATILIATRHAAPATCTQWDKQTRFFERNKDKRKTKRTYLKFEFKPHQVNDSSQLNQGTDHLVSQSPPWWVHWQQKHKVWVESKTPWSTARRPKKPGKAQQGHLEEEKSQKPANDTKSEKAKQNDKEELGKAQRSKKNSNQGKSSKSAQTLKINTPPEINSP